jgi:hypothetical protein
MTESDILLNDLLGFTKEEINNVKIRFNQASGDFAPLEQYLADREAINSKAFLWTRKQRFFKKGQIAIAFLHLTPDTWLLTTIKHIDKVLDVDDGVGYEATELERYSKYYGRVIIKYHKTMQAQGVFYKNVCNDLIVNQILSATFEGDDFHGYDKVRLSYNQLATIINTNKRDWISALSGQKAVYLIMDRSNGKLYVGSATGKSEMLLQRWKNYVENGHGGNKELKDLVEHEGFDYVKQNFQYSILENFNSKVDDNYILERESWWKDTLQSRTFGYNAN